MALLTYWIHRFRIEDAAYSNAVQYNLQVIAHRFIRFFFFEERQRSALIAGAYFRINLHVDMHMHSWDSSRNNDQFSGGQSPTVLWTLKLEVESSGAHCSHLAVDVNVK